MDIAITGGKKANDLENILLSMNYELTDRSRVMTPDPTHFIRRSSTHVGLDVLRKGGV